MSGLDRSAPQPIPEEDPSKCTNGVDPEQLYCKLELLQQQGFIPRYLLVQQVLERYSPVMPTPPSPQTTHSSEKTATPPQETHSAETVRAAGCKEQGLDSLSNASTAQTSTDSMTDLYRVMRISTKDARVIEAKSHSGSPSPGGVEMSCSQPGVKRKQDREIATTARQDGTSVAAQGTRNRPRSKYEISPGRKSKFTELFDDL